ncbi:hypothetical protein COL60_10445 [Bacillus pseudomycoides]|nr:hypothetical protein COL60_10445 [Bacillus pseudomycoides]
MILIIHAKMSRTARGIISPHIRIVANAAIAPIPPMQAIVTPPTSDRMFAKNDPIINPLESFSTKGNPAPPKAQ